MTIEVGTHSGSRNVVVKFILHILQNPQNQKSVFIPRRKSKIKTVSQVLKSFALDRSWNLKASILRGYKKRYTGRVLLHSFMCPIIEAVTEPRMIHKLHKRK